MSKHLKRLAAPRTWRLERKNMRWITKPLPGPHSIDAAVPLSILVRDYLNLANTQKEAKRIISNGEILVDGTARKEDKFPCGLMDVVSIPKLKKHFRVLFDQQGKLCLVPISDKKAKWKLCRIENKTTIKGNKTQINLHDGRNILADKDEYKTGDVLKILLSDKKISDVFPFEKGNVSLIIGGSHVGQMANINELEITRSSGPNRVTMKGDSEFSTIKNYVFVIGQKKPEILISEVKMQ